eukprot:1293379-Rhodomonas_salina.1
MSSSLSHTSHPHIIPFLLPRAYQQHLCAPAQSQSVAISSTSRSSLHLTKPALLPPGFRLGAPCGHRRSQVGRKPPRVAPGQCTLGRATVHFGARMGRICVAVQAQTYAVAVRRSPYASADMRRIGLPGDGSAQDAQVPRYPPPVT